MRFIESFNFKIDELVLIGEFVFVEKDVNDVFVELIFFVERINMVFMGIIVIYGWVKGVVVLIGMKIEIGKIVNFVNF